MKIIKILPTAMAVLFALTFVSNIEAATKLNADMQAHVDDYDAQVRAMDPAFKGFTVEAGKKLYYMERMHTKKNKLRSCTSCHTKDPAKPGRTNVGKHIDPVSPAVTPERFTEVKKVEKWFRRNCKWVLQRECTPREKGDYITYMMSL